MTDRISPDSLVLGGDDRAGTRGNDMKTEELK